MNRTSNTFFRCTAAVATAAALAAPLWAGAQDTLSPRAQYQRDRANCMDGNTTQDRASCLYEARSVLRDARSGRLEQAEVAEQTLQDNKLMRCERVPEDARSSCERLALGEGLQEGSVAEGAVLMWLAENETEPTVVSVLD